MTLPSSGNISLGQVLDELRAANPNRGYPISLGDTDVRALAGVPSGDISLGHLYGKSAISPLTATGNNDYAFARSTYSNGTVYCYPSVSTAGGSGTKRFAWSILSTNMAVTLTGADQPRCGVSCGYVKQSQGSVIAYLRCVVSDDTGSVTVDNIVAQLEWEGSM